MKSSYVRKTKLTKHQQQATKAPHQETKISPTHNASNRQIRVKYIAELPIGPAASTLDINNDIVTVVVQIGLGFTWRLKKYALITQRCD